VAAGRLYPHGDQCREEPRKTRDGGILDRAATRS
jgi:hypothetical protein